MNRRSLIALAFLVAPALSLASHAAERISLDGPEAVHDLYRFNKQGKGTWKQVMRGIETMQKNKVEFNVLCVLSQANVNKPKEVYRFFRSLGIEYLQYIPLSEFDAEGNPLPFTITPEQYGRFLCEIFDLWWPDRRKVRIRVFDNIAEALTVSPVLLERYLSEG